jgi:hypothetical protein
LQYRRIPMQRLNYNLIALVAAFGLSGLLFTATLA